MCKMALTRRPKSGYRTLWLLEDADPGAEFAAMSQKAQKKHRRAFMSKIAVYEFAVQGVRAACGLPSAPTSA